MTLDSCAKEFLRLKTVEQLVSDLGLVTYNIIYNICKI